MSNSWSTRMRLLPEAVADTLLDVHETHVYQPLRKGLEKVASLSFFPRAVLPNHVTWMSMACALPFVLLTVYGWHFAAAVLTIFHDMLDRLDGTTPTCTLTPASTPRAHPCPSSSPRRCRRRPAQGVRRSRRRAARLP